MTADFTERAARAVDRYGFFLNILRSQADMVFRRGPTAESLRQEALQVAFGAARTYVGTEQGLLNDDSGEVARDAYKRALDDLGMVPDEGLEGLNRFADFVFANAAYVTRILAAQAERDVMSMAQHIHATAMRIDLYVRSGRHSMGSAAAAVMLEDAQAPAFKFIDRMGRRFKATKHIRDIYRMHLLHVANEVYMDTVAEHGHDHVYVAHPEPSYKWNGQPLAIVSGVSDHPLYYDVKEEIFHPSSESTLTIMPPEDLD